MTLQPSIIDALEQAGLSPQYVEDVVRLALAEDLGAADGLDVTTVATVPASARSSGELIARAAGVIAGLPVAAAVFDVAVGAGSEQPVTFTTHVQESAAVLTGDVLATVTGSTRGLLIAERTALNLLSRISGVATHTFLWAQELVGTGVKVLDTRKTTPGLRMIEKYAVRCGGGENKRFGLFDAALIKDNHKQAVGSLTAAFRAVQQQFPNVPIQVEVSNVAEAKEAEAIGATYLLCDNMSVDVLKAVVAAVGAGVELEATGGLTLDRAREYAETGVHYLSVGGLTHSSPIVDIAFDLLDD